MYGFFFHSLHKLFILIIELENNLLLFYVGITQYIVPTHYIRNGNDDDGNDDKRAFTLFSRHSVSSLCVCVTLNVDIEINENSRIVQVRGMRRKASPRA